MADGQVVVPVAVSQSQIERAVQAAVSVHTQDLIQEFSRSLALKSDELRAQHQALLDRIEAARDRVDAKIKDVDSSLEALPGRVEAVRERVDARIKDVDTSLEALPDRVEATRNRVDAKIKDVDSSLDTLQTKVNSRVTTYVVPAVVLTVISVVLAIFTAVGGFDVIEKVKNLKDGVDAANKTYSTDVDPKLTELKAKVAAALATADAERLNQLQDKVTTLQNEYEANQKKNSRNNGQGGKGTQSGQDNK
jgi:Mg2+ and Co2+ transporter CorA